MQTLAALTSNPDPSFILYIKLFFNSANSLIFFLYFHCLVHNIYYFILFFFFFPKGTISWYSQRFAWCPEFSRFMKKAAGDLLNFLILAMLYITFKNFHSKTLYIYCVKYSELLFTCKAWLIRWNKTSLGNKRQSQRP